MTTRFSLRSTLVTVAAAVLCAGLQLTASIAVAGDAPKAVGVEQLPKVIVTAKREASVVAVQKLPKVVVIGRRTAPDLATAQTRGGAASAAS